MFVDLLISTTSASGTLSQSDWEQIEKTVFTRLYAVSIDFVVTTCDSSTIF